MCLGSVTEQEAFADDDMSVAVHKAARVGGEHLQQRRFVGRYHIHHVVVTHVVNVDLLFVCYCVDDSFGFAALL